MSEMMAVNVIHVVSYCWVIGRTFSPRGARRPDLIDYPVGFVAASSFVVVAINGVTEGLPETVTSAQETPLMLLGLIISIAVVYVVLTWLSVKIRVAVGRPSRVADELEVRLG